MAVSRKVAFVGGLAASTAALVWMESLPHGAILRFELAATRGTAGAVLHDWTRLDLADDYVRRDFAYLATYWLPPFAAAGWAASRHAARGRHAWARRGRWVAALPVCAAGLDAVENAFLLRQVAEAQRVGPLVYGATGPAHLAPLAAVAAASKFLLLLLVVAYVAGALVPPGRAS
ncbi:MAG TPA: hypothetical protein VGX28_10715 [Frankiaceae bacterium]|jgi:hypothetical protein|nr:hypothetical protein [Frankiaceae bacterium]